MKEAREANDKRLAIWFHRCGIDNLWKQSPYNQRLAPEITFLTPSICVVLSCCLLPTVPYSPTPTSAYGFCPVGPSLCPKHIPTCTHSELTAAPCVLMFFLAFFSFPGSICSPLSPFLLTSAQSLVPSVCCS